MSQTVVNTLPPRKDPFTKAESLNGLNIVLNHFLYGFVSPKLVPPEAWKDASRKTAVFASREGDIEIQLGPLVRRAFDDDYTAREGFKRNYENSLLRTLMREAHELILLYCEDTQQVPIYGSAQESVETLILRGFAHDDEFGLQSGHSLSFQQQIAKVFVSAASA